MCCWWGGDAGGEFQGLDGGVAVALAASTSPNLPISVTMVDQSNRVDLLTAQADSESFTPYAAPPGAVKKTVAERQAETEAKKEAKKEVKAAEKREKQEKKAQEKLVKKQENKEIADKKKADKAALATTVKAATGKSKKRNVLN